MLTEDALQPYTDGLEIKTDDQRLADVSTVCPERGLALNHPLENRPPFGAFFRRGSLRMGGASSTKVLLGWCQPKDILFQALGWLEESEGKNQGKLRRKAEDLLFSP